MLGDFLTRLLLLILGYAYPAFECFKTVERNRVEIEELRFWCKYWILVAFLTVFERISDILISWLPLYGELKLTLFIYLWYPKTRGTGFVYDALLRPYMAKHETEVDRKIQELRARAWDLALSYWQNCSEMGLAKFFEMFQYLAGQSLRLNLNQGANQKSDQQLNSKVPPPPSPHGFRSHSGKNFSATIFNRSGVDSPRSKLAPVQPDSPAEYEFDFGDDSIPLSPSNTRIQQARLKLRRSKPQT